MSDRLERAQVWVDTALESIGQNDHESATSELLIAVDQLITEIRELRIEVGK